MYRFVGVAPGTYALKSELTGFLPQEVAAVAVGLGRTATVDFTLKIGGLSENGRRAGDRLEGRCEELGDRHASSRADLLADDADLLVDVDRAAEQRAGHQQQLRPTAARARYGNALLLDGVDTRDPEGGSAWTFFNQNLIQEIQIGGLGAAAEYGGFTGAIINTVTKSGGNAFSGPVLAALHGRVSGQRQHRPQRARREPVLGEAAITKKLTDYTVQLGGPIKKDKAFFFVNVQRYSAQSDPVGPVANSSDISPALQHEADAEAVAVRHGDRRHPVRQLQRHRVASASGRPHRRPIARPSRRTRPSGSGTFSGRERSGRAPCSRPSSPATTATTTWIRSTRRPLPTTPIPTNTAMAAAAGSITPTAAATRARSPCRSTRTRSARTRSSSALEIERSHVRTQYQPYGPAGFYVLAYSGVPTFHVNNGYDVQGDNHRTSAYAQDAWSIGPADAEHRPPPRSHPRSQSGAR